MVDQAFAIFSGFEDAVQEQIDLNLPESQSSSIDVSTKVGLQQKLAKQKNSIAFLKEGIMGMVSRACTKEWPGGLAYLVVKNLMK